jgi:transposase
VLWLDLRARIQALLADKADDAQKRVLDLLACAGGQAVIPPRKTRKVPRGDAEDMEKARHLMENFCVKLTQCRGIATRYDKKATTFLGAVYLAAAVIWLN